MLANATREPTRHLDPNNAMVDGARFRLSPELEGASHPHQPDPIVAEDLYGQREALRGLNQALLQARRLYRDQFDFAPVAFVLSDAEGIIQEANLAAAELLAARQHWLPDKSLALFLAPAEQGLFQDALARWHQTGIPQAWDTSLCLPSGWMNEVHITIGMPPEWARKLNSLCSICWSLQARGASPPEDGDLGRLQSAPSESASGGESADWPWQAADAELAVTQNSQMPDASAVQRVDEPLALIIHDLQHPLTIIHGYIDILYRELIKNERLDLVRLQKGFSEIQAASTRMSAQLAALLGDASIASGEPASSDIAPTNLATLVRRTAEAYQQLTTAHMIEVVTPTMLIGRWDNRRIAQVLDNLLSNSIKYSPQGGLISLIVTLEVQEQQEWATISVQDHGIGIPIEDLEHIFEPFHRSQLGTGHIRGTGLGLASVRLLIEQLGGTVKVSSAVGYGSTFVVRLPLQR